MVQSRLLDIASREFSLKGLEGASTREIAAAAGTVMSSITYHYGGKEGLYLAVADHIATQMAKDLATPGAEPPPLPDSPSGARAEIHQLLDRFVDKMISEESACWSLFIVREQLNPTAAFDRIWGGSMGRMMQRLAALVRIAAGEVSPLSATTAAISLFGSVVVLRAGRASCLRLLGKADFDSPTIHAIKRRVAANADAALDALTAERQELQ